MEIKLKQLEREGKAVDEAARKELYDSIRATYTEQMKPQYGAARRGSIRSSIRRKRARRWRGRWRQHGATRWWRDSAWEFCRPKSCWKREVYCSRFLAMYSEKL